MVAWLPVGWEAGMEFLGAIADRFAAYIDELTKIIAHADRAERLRDYCAGLLVTEGRRSVEPMAAVTAPAEVSAQHQRLLHFVANAPWSDEQVLAKVGELVTPSMTRQGPIEAWIIDDTSFPKKGRHSVGVHHQYCGQLGKQANCQVAVTLSIANHHGSLPIAYQLYLPRDWTDDKARRAEAHVPGAIRFKTKPQMALEQIRGALKAGVARGVLLMDASYGTNSALRLAITELGLCYVAAIISTVKVRPVSKDDPNSRRLSVATLAGRQQRETAVALCPRACLRGADARPNAVRRRDAADRMAQGRSRTDEILARERRPRHVVSRLGRSGQVALAHRARLSGTQV